MLIDAETHDRIDVLPDRKAETLETWLRDHPGVEIVCRDGSVSYAEAIRRALPDATQVSERWHLWHGLARAVEKAVVAQRLLGEGRSQATGTDPQTHDCGTLARRPRPAQQGRGPVGLRPSAGLALNTVKRYARAPEPERLGRPPQYRACQVDAYRDHLRRRHTEEPGVPVMQLLKEIRSLGYTDSLNLLYKYVNQGRLEGDRITPSPRRLTSWIMTRPEDLPDKHRAHLGELLAACPEMTAVARLVRAFAQLMVERRGSDLDSWMTDVRTAQLPELEPFLNGFDQDREAAVAGLTLPYSNGPTEGVNTKTKLIKRQMYGRARFPLLRHRILLAQFLAPSPPKARRGLSRDRDRPGSPSQVRARDRADRYPAPVN